MNLYCFRLNRYKKCIEKIVFQVEEKPKTYITTNTTWKSRINKSDIGKVVSYDKVHLLEDDAEKAKEIFAVKIKKEIDCDKERINSIKKEIASLKELQEFLTE